MNSLKFPIFRGILKNGHSGNLSKNLYRREGGGGGANDFFKSAKIFAGIYFDCLFSMFFVTSLKQDIYMKKFSFSRGRGL